MAQFKKNIVLFFSFSFSVHVSLFKGRNLHVISQSSVAAHTEV